MDFLQLTVDAVADTVEDVGDALYEIRVKELAAFASTTKGKKPREKFPVTLFVQVSQYMRYLGDVWGNIALHAVRLEYPLIDLINTVGLAIATSAVLFGAMLWCQLCSIPVLNSIYRFWSENFGGSLGLVNASNPELFNSLTPEQLQYAKEALELSVQDSPSTRENHVFDLDMAKFLLQLASIVYERDPDAAHAELLGLATNPEPIKASKPSQNKPLGIDESAIGEFCMDHNVRWQAVSELNTSSSAFASFFWDAEANWIVVTLKGTGATEYADWITDMSVSLVPADDFLPGWGKTIDGFKDRIWPAKDEYPEELVGAAWVDGENPNLPPIQKPYETIRVALCKLANALSANRTDGKDINVWFTGHSLGCALATLVYCRAINNPEDFSGTNIRIRDAYIFAAPVVGNRAFSQKFNEIINHATYTRTLWRITNSDDAVATLLPQLGDDPSSKITDTNPFGYAHVGAELKMRDYPEPCQVTGSLFQEGSKVEVRSKATTEELLAAREKVISNPAQKAREELERKLEAVPLIGRFVAHDTVLYWDQLDRIAAGRVNWLPPKKTKTA